MTALLSVHGLSMRFGGVTAVEALSFEVQPSEIVALIGPNGAGKTTVFNVLTGVYAPTSGSISFAGAPIVDRFSISTALQLLALALGSGLLALVAFNAQPLWQATIVDLYVYLEPFAWWGALATFFSFLHGLPFNETILPFVIGFVVAAAAFFITWYRSRRSVDQVARYPLARTFQNIRLFKQMSVLDNVLVALRGSAAAEPHARAYELLLQVGLSEQAALPASALAYGEQRRLEIARALARAPRLLLLDEPAAGMNPSEARDLMELIRGIRDRGTAIVLIEHHMQVVMGLSDRIIVLEYGKMIAQGSPAEIRCNQRVIDAYLGTGAHDE